MTASFEIGFVTFVNSKEYTCVVSLSNGATLDNVHMMNVTGGMQQIEVTNLTNYLGASVLLAYVLGRWFIIGTLPVPGDRTQGSKDKASEYGIEVSGESPVMENISFKSLQKSASRTTNSEYTFAKYSPTGFMPGDKVLAADGGASLGIYRKNLIVMKAASLAQIILGGLRNFIRIVARELSIITDFGEIKSVHAADGDIGLVIKGGANSAECTPDGANYTVNTYLGSVPGVENGRYSVKVTDNGEDYAAYTMEKTGNYNMGASKDFNVVAHQNATIHATEQMGLQSDGDYLLSVEGTTKEELAGDKSTTCLGKIESYAGNSIVETSAGGKKMMLMGALEIAATGISFTTSVSGSPAECTVKCKSMNIVSG